MQLRETKASELQAGDRVVVSLPFEGPVRVFTVKQVGTLMGNHSTFCELQMTNGRMYMLGDDETTLTAGE